MRAFSTLRSQFVAVVAAAVILSNLAVVAILEIGREGDLQTARINAAVDRIAAVFRYIDSIPHAQRDGAVVALSGVAFHYSISISPPFSAQGMSAEEKQMAADLTEGERTDKVVPARVRLTEPIIAAFNTNGAALEITQPFPTGDGGWTARFVRPQTPSPAPDILIAAALGTILTGAAAAWLAGRVSRPLSALAYAADEVARGRTAPKLSADGPEDIRRAAEAFNEMSRRLTRNLDELQSLTEAVLSAARAGPGEEQRRTDLATLIESICDDLIELNLPVEVEIHGLAPCSCRPNEIRRAVRNLIENAVRYGGSARVSLKTEPAFFVATIDDDGPGSPQNPLEEVFEPFVRLEESRNSATGGAGLGLTLARSIVREHGGDIVLENRRNGGRRMGFGCPLPHPPGEAS